MSKEFEKNIILAIYENAEQKKIDPELVKNFLIEAIKKIYYKKFQVENLFVDIDLKAKKFSSKIELEVVTIDTDYDDFCQILENDPLVIEKGLKPGDKFFINFDIITQFSRNEVHQILQTFKQRIIEVVNNHVYDSWKSKIGSIVVAEFEKVDKKTGGYYINLKDIEGVEPTTGFLPKKEQNKNEKDFLHENQHYAFVVKEVVQQSKFWPVILSRTSEKLVEYYMQQQIVEIKEELIKICKISRIAGFKSKIFVQGLKNISEPVAICIGLKGNRIKEISKQLGNEKIEIFQFYDNILIDIATVLDFNRIKGIYLEYNNPENPDKPSSAIVVANTNDDLLFIVGKQGNNILLSSKFLDIKIDVKLEQDLDLDQELEENKLKYSSIFDIEKLKNEYDLSNSETISNFSEIENEIEEYDEQINDYSELPVDHLDLPVDHEIIDMLDSNNKNNKNNE